MKKIAMTCITLITGALFISSMPSAGAEQNGQSAAPAAVTADQTKTLTQNAQAPETKEAVPAVAGQEEQKAPAHDPAPQQAVPAAGESGTAASPVVNEPSSTRDTGITQTLVGNKKVRLSGYGAPMVRMGESNGNFMAFAGAKAGLMIDSFVIGGAYFIYTGYMEDVANNGHKHNILTQYGGFVLEYNFFPKNIVNFSVGSIIGPGTSGYVSEEENSHHDHDDYDDHHHDDYYYKYHGTYFFVLEPEIMLYVNVTRFFRVGVGVSYRFTDGLDEYGLTDKTFDGFNGLLMLQFGWF